MKTTLYTLTILFVSTLSLQAQLGINLGYRINNAPDWKAEINSEVTEFPGDGFSIGLDYWIPMKAYRVDFLPEINYAQFEEITLEDVATFENKAYSFFLNTNIYLFDLEGDCDCPTFSKSGGFFSKGFFVQASPGITYLESKREEQGGQSITEGTTSYSLGLGAGLDIGFSDFFTLTPIVSYRYFLSTTVENVEESTLPGSVNYNEIDTNIKQVYAGVRLGFRFRN